MHVPYRYLLPFRRLFLDSVSRHYARQKFELAQLTLPSHSSLNFFLLVSGSSGAIPFGTLLALVALWFLISVPLTLVGSWLGIRHGGWSTPTRVNAIPRQIPPVLWYLRPLQSAVMAGILPFGAAFLELFFVLNSLFGTKSE